MPNCLIIDVNIPATTRIIPCPNENKNNIRVASIRLLDTEAKLIIPARIGVEQGVPASAKVAPKSIGYKNILLPLD